MASHVVRKTITAFLAFSFMVGYQSGNSNAWSAASAKAAATTLSFVKEDKASNLKEYRLNSNGLKVLLQEKHNSPVVTVMVVYKVGSRNEAVGYTGSTHFLEHMMFKGTAKHDPLKGTGLDDLLKPMGGLNNATTSYDRTNYYEVVPSKNLEVCLEVEADRMRNALLRSSDRQSEMTVVRNELERGENEAEEILTNQLFATAFREHPYHHPVIGWRSDVEGVPIERLRQFFHDFYYPNNATLLVIGDFKTADALTMINKYFSKVPAAPKPFPKVYTTEPAQEGERKFIVQRGDELPKLMIGYHIPNAKDPDTFPLEVLASLLGDNRRQSSRLYTALIDSGLASEAYAANFSMKDPGLFTIYASATNGTKLERIQKSIEDTIENLAKNPVSDADLDKAKKAVWKKGRLMSDDPMNFAQQIADAEAVADWQWWLNLEPKIKAVTAADVQRVAKKYFKASNRSVGFYLPKDKEEAEKKGALPKATDGLRPVAYTETSSVTVLEPPDAAERSVVGAADRSVGAAERSVGAAERSVGAGADSVNTASGSQIKGIARIATSASQFKDAREIASIGSEANAPTSIAPVGTESNASTKIAASTTASVTTSVSSASPSKGMIASKTKIKVLANGASIYYMPVRGTGVVAISGKLKGGNSLRQADKGLVPSLLGEMLTKGSKSYSKEQLADILESMGITLEVDESTFWTEFDSEVVSEDFEKLLSVLSDSLYNPNLHKDELEKIIKQRDASLRDALVDTGAMADNVLSGSLYTADCVYYHKPFSSQLEELKNISTHDLREFHKKQFVGKNLVLAVVGDISETDAFNLAEKYFGAWAAGDEASMSVTKCACETKPGKLIISQIPDKSSVNIIMAAPANVNIKSKDFCAAQLANSALGHDTIASRLAAVREKHGLTYGITSMFAENAESWSPWEVELTVNPENTTKALKLVRGIISDFVSKGMTAEELSMEKQRMSGEYVVHRMRTPKHLAESLTKYGALGLGPEFMDTYPLALQKVTLKEANAAISKYMKIENLTTSVAGTVPADVK